MDKTQIISIVVMLIIVAIQGNLIFRDAIKNKISYPWLWGIIGLLNFPSSAIIYIVYKKYIRKK